MHESKPIGLIALFLVLGLLGQYLFKLGMSCAENVALTSSLATDISSLFSGNLSGIWQALLHTVELLIDPYIIAGLFSYALSTVCWLAILSKTDLSFAYPMLSIGYVAILLMGRLAFGEDVSLMRWLGVFLIITGIIAVYSEMFFAKRSLWVTGFLLIMTVLLVYSGHNSSLTLDFEKPVALIAVTIPMGILGQLFFKAGMNKKVNKDRVKFIGEAAAALKSGKVKAAISGVKHTLLMFISPLVLVGLGCYGLSTVLWLVLLTKVPLSFLYPMLSFGYVIILLLGKFLFKENVTPFRWYGVLLICFGIVLIYSESLVSAYIAVFAAAMAVMAAVPAVLCRIFPDLRLNA